MKELTTHIAETNHFDQQPQAIIEKQSLADTIFDGKRKKSLPVRKLLELERSNAASLITRKSNEKGPGTKMKFNCDKCGEKYESNQIMDHIRKCTSSRKGTDQIENIVDISNEEEAIGTPNHVSKLEDMDEVSIVGNTSDVSTVFSPSSGSYSLTSTSSILGSLERMVESSFKGFKNNSVATTESGSTAQTKFKEESKDTTLTDSSRTILQRLGFDDNTSHDTHNSRSNQTYNNTVIDGSHAQQLIGRSQSPFPLQQTQNKIHDSQHLFITL